VQRLGLQRTRNDDCSRQNASQDKLNEEGRL